MIYHLQRESHRLNKNTGKTNQQMNKKLTKWFDKYIKRITNLKQGGERDKKTAQKRECENKRRAIAHYFEMCVWNS